MGFSATGFMENVFGLALASILWFLKDGGILYRKIVYKSLDHEHGFGPEILSSYGGIGHCARFATFVLGILWV